MDDRELFFVKAILLVKNDYDISLSSWDFHAIYITNLFLWSVLYILVLSLLTWCVGFHIPLVCEMVPGSWLLSLEHGSSILLFLLLQAIHFCVHACVLIMGILGVFDHMQVFGSYHSPPQLENQHSCGKTSVRKKLSG